MRDLSPADYDEFTERILAALAPFAGFPAWFASLSQEDRNDLRDDVREEIEEIITIDLRPVDTSPEAQAALLERVERVCEEVKDVTNRCFGRQAE